MCERIYSNEELTVIRNFKKQNPHICTYCNKPIPPTDTVTVDHKIPYCKGGKTIPENLVIACYPCNREKDDMGVEEYIIFKQKQNEMLENYEVNIVINELVTMHNKIINRINEVSNEYSSIDKEIIRLQQDIMWSKFNACEGYLLTKRMNELLLKQDELRVLKLGFTRLHEQLGAQRKNIVDTKVRIQVEVKSANRMYFRRYASETCKRGRGNKSKVEKIEIVSELRQTAR